MAVDETTWRRVVTAVIEVFGEEAGEAVLTILPRERPATKADLDALEERVNARFAALDARLEAQFAIIDARFDATRFELRTEIANSARQLSSDLEAVLRQYLFRAMAGSGVMVLGAVGLALGLR